MSDHLVPDCGATAISLTVQQNSSAVSLSSSAGSAQFGQSVVLTATVTSSSGAMPTGTVTFQDGTTVLGVAVLSATASGAQATLAISALAIGSHSITAVYNGDNGLIGSTSAAVMQTVSQDSTTTNLSSSNLQALSGQTVTLTATVTGSNGGTPTGTVTFMDGSTVLGTATLSAASSGAQATFTTSTLADGAHILTTVYSGDSTFSGSTSDSLNQFVSDGTTLSSATSLSSSNLQAATGQVVTFTATVTGVDGGTPTGTVTFEDGSTVLGSVALSAGSSGAQAIFNTSALAAGSHSITAVYSGDTNYSGSTSPAVSETVQSGSSSGTGTGNTSSGTGNTGSGSTGPGTGTVPDSGVLGGSSDGTTVSDLFDGKIASDSGISTVVSGAASIISSVSSMMSSSALNNSGNTAATPPQGPLDSSSSSLSTSGNYRKHYTEWGNNGTSSFYLDVIDSSTFSSSGETGTVTYTAYLQSNGSVVMNQRKIVVPYTNSIVFANGTTLGNLPSSGELTGYGMADFGFNLFAWDQMHYRESDSYNPGGSYTAANSTSYSINQTSSITSSWDSTRANTGNSAVYTNQYGDTWNYNLTASDPTANFTTSLSSPPADGTTFLAQASDNGSDVGFSITINNVVNGQDSGLVQSLWFSSYSDTSGGRYYYNNTATVNGSGSGNSDKVTWNVNQQSSNNYSGSQFGNMSYSSSSPSGTTTATVSSSGQSFSNISMTNAYQRSSSGSGSGNYQFSSNSTQSYSSQATEQQNYSSGSLSADTLTYRNGASASGSQSASNNDSYTATALKGTTKGSDYSISSSSAQSQSSASGTINLLTNTYSANSISSSNASGWSLSFSTANYNASDGSYSGPRKLDHRLSYRGGPGKGEAMKGKRKQHTAAFKAQVALAAVRGDKTVNELAGQYGVHPTLIHGWKKQLLAGAEQVFGNGSKAATADAEAQKAELFEQIGRLKMELEWLKKSRPARLNSCGVWSRRVTRS